MRTTNEPATIPMSQGVRLEAACLPPQSWEIPAWQATGPMSARTAYALGDYSRAAMQADTDELRGCALVMLGHHEAGLPLLESLTSPRARFVRAFGLWGLRQGQEAQALLKTVLRDPHYGPQAAALQRMIERPVVRVLLQGRDDPGCPDYDFVGALRQVAHIDVKTVGYSSRSDVQIDLTTTYEQVMAQLPADWWPDFFLSHLVEDNPPPIGIERAPFPTICHTQDFDRHFHHCQHYLRLFDAVIALGSADHHDFRRLTDASVFVFPKLLGVCPRQVQRLQRRETDVFVSGSLFNLTRDKAQFLWDVSQLPANYKVDLLDGYCTTDEYYRRLAGAKATFTYVHRWGLINGRAIEAISQGTCAIYQEGGELGLFLSEEDGAIPYRLDNAMQVLTRVVDQWDQKYSRCGQQGSWKVARVFDIRECVERYVRFLTFCATQPIHKSQRMVDPQFSKMRWPNRSPQRIWWAFDHSPAKLLELHQAFRETHADSEEYHRLDACGEAALYTYLLQSQQVLPETVSTGIPSRYRLRRFASRAYRAAIRRLHRVRGMHRLTRLLKLPDPDPRPRLVTPGASHSLKDAIDCYRKLCALFPNRLAARFNLARLLVEQQQPSEAVPLLIQTCADPTLHYEPTDLLFWREFQDEGFDYELVMQQLIEYAKDGDAEHVHLIEQVIRESALHSWAAILADAGHTDEALTVLEDQVTPETRFARLWTLQARLQAGTDQCGAAAESLRQALQLNRSMLATTPADWLEQIDRGGGDVRDLRERQELLISRRAA